MPWLSSSFAESTVNVSVPCEPDGGPLQDLLGVRSSSRGGVLEERRVEYLDPREEHLGFLTEVERELAGGSGPAGEAASLPVAVIERERAGGSLEGARLRLICVARIRSGTLCIAKGLGSSR